MASSLGNRQRIYVVDDEHVIATTLAIILAQNGFDALAFGSAKEAITAAEALPPDLLLTDVVMPDMNGIELAIQFRQKYPDCKVLLFSGQAATNNLLEEAKGAGYDLELLSKPVHPQDLLARLSYDPASGRE
ncbi:response regulator [Terriglobus albidus]|uniref:Response regulator n=2 Tax=Terriglobus albidus TaxID=1592106 RepID=A0A5B9EID6_9BACT|nr:response regulator [Terriglobus albidus]